MKKLLVLVLALIILTFTGCRNTNNNLSNPSAFSSETASSNDEINSSESISSSDLASTQTSTEVNYSSEINKPSNPTVSNNETKSKNETSSSDVATPITYFEKHNLKITQISNELCFNDDPNHKCPYDKEISLSVKSINQNMYRLFDAELFGDNFNVSTYKEIEYHNFAVYTYDWQVCHMGGLNSIITFDKYTGNIICYGALGENGWQELNFNNKKIYVAISNGGGAGGYVHSVICPIDYDGAVFAILKDKSISSYEWYNDGNTHMIDEIIDFENDKYYLFAMNN